MYPARTLRYTSLEVTKWSLYMISRVVRRSSVCLLFVVRNLSVSQQACMCIHIWQSASPLSIPLYYRVSTLNVTNSQQNPKVPDGTLPAAMIKDVHGLFSLIFAGYRVCTRDVSFYLALWCQGRVQGSSLYFPASVHIVRGSRHFSLFLCVTVRVFVNSLFRRCFPFFSSSVLLEARLCVDLVRR